MSLQGAILQSDVRKGRAVPAPSAYHKAKWMPEEDQRLLQGIAKHGTKNWTLVATFVSGRSPKQCRERWTGQLDPQLNRDSWTAKEDAILYRLQKENGNAWARLVQFLPGRSANAIKNRYKLMMKKHELLARAEAEASNESPALESPSKKPAEVAGAHEILFNFDQDALISIDNDMICEWL